MLGESWVHDHVEAHVELCALKQASASSCVIIWYILVSSACMGVEVWTVAEWIEMKTDIDNFYGIVLTIWFNEVKEMESFDLIEFCKLYGQNGLSTTCICVCVCVYMFCKYLEYAQSWCAVSIDHL